MKLKYISWLPSVVIMCIIFIFSSKTATESGQSSMEIANTLVSAYEYTTNNQLDMEYRQDILPKLDHIVRKVAHGMEYAILAASIVFHFWVQGYNTRKIFFLAILISGMYAGTDEFHQLFIDGRSGQITDVGIDTLGACIGTIITLCVFLSIKKKQTVST
jgi:VanZ family protein